MIEEMVKKIKRKKKKKKRERKNFGKEYKLFSKS